MIIRGDSHNFGQRVHLQVTDSGNAVVKPRSVYWEYLFLDSSSPLRSVLREISAASPILDFDSILGNITISTESNYFNGRAIFFSPVEFVLKEDWFRKFGQLAAVCSAFGIIDLHQSNCAPTPNGFQLLDVECVFKETTLLQESCLLPNRSILWDRSALGAFLDRKKFSLKNCEVAQIIQGVEETLLLLGSSYSSFVWFDEAYKKQMSLHPIRFLARPTSHYSQVQPDYFPEEYEQLTRDDIPYFFGYYGRDDFYYFSGREEIQSIQEVPEWLRLKQKSAFRTITFLLQPERLQKLRKQILAECIYSLADPQEVPYDDGTVKIDRSNDFLRVRTASSAVQVTRRVVYA